MLFSVCLLPFMHKGDILFLLETAALNKNKIYIHFNHIRKHFKLFIFVGVSKKK